MNLCEAKAEVPKVGRTAKSSASRACSPPDPVLISSLQHSMVVEIPNRYKHVDRILTRAGPFTNPDDFLPGESTQQFLRSACKILVIGKWGYSIQLQRSSNIMLTCCLMTCRRWRTRL